jgi:two-component system, OmpR family, response regulator
MAARVLIVDDEATCARILTTFLKDEGYDVRTALSGTEAVDLGATFVPDVLVSDWMLKDRLHGIDVAVSLRERNPRMEVIFFTGLAEWELRARSKAAAIEPFRIYEKPCRIETLVAGVKEALTQAAHQTPQPAQQPPAL